MKEINTKTEHIELHESGIVVCSVNKLAYMELEDGVENLNAIREISNGVKVPVLVDILASKGATKECREYFASPDAAEIQSACALLIKSPLSRLIGNFFIGLNKTIFPTKLFTDKQEAMGWLKTHL